MSNDAKYEMVPGVDVKSGDIVTAVPIRSEKKSMAGRVCKYCGFLSIAFILFFLILSAIVYHGGVHLIHKVGSVVIPKLTVDAPLDFPTVLLTESERNDLEILITESERRDVENRLVLTEREFNGLFFDEEKSGHMYATFSENKVSVDFSFPAGDIPGGEGRFFVGSKSLIIQDEAYYNIEAKITTSDITSWGEFLFANMTVHMDLDDDDLDVRITSAEVFGWMATDRFVHKFFDGINLEGGFSADDMKDIKGVTIGDGKI
eukprot:scaffold18759_cov52-Attheya_sp.AAC.1